MAKIDLPYQIINDSPANASPVQSDFTRIEQHINSELIERGGTVAMIAQLRLVGNPVAPLDAAPKQYVDSIIPIGGILTFGGVAAPPGGVWLLCDGSPYETAMYPALFAVIGVRFGGSGGFFNVPHRDRPSARRWWWQVRRRGPGRQRRRAGPRPHAHGDDHAHGNTGDGRHQPLPQPRRNDQPCRPPLGDEQRWQPPPRRAGRRARVHHRRRFGHRGGDRAPGYSGYSITPFTTSNGDHGHTVTDHATTVPANTTYMNQNNVHPHTTAAFSGNTTSTGVASAELNMPPYVGVTYLIRAA